MRQLQIEQDVLEPHLHRFSCLFLVERICQPGFSDTPLAYGKQGSFDFIMGVSVCWDSNAEDEDIVPEELWLQNQAHKIGKALDVVCTSIAMDRHIHLETNLTSVHPFLSWYLPCQNPSCMAQFMRWTICELLLSLCSHSPYCDKFRFNER